MSARRKVVLESVNLTVSGRLFQTPSVLIESACLPDWVLVRWTTADVVDNKRRWRRSEFNEETEQRLFEFGELQKKG